MSFYVDESNFSLSLSLSLFILKILITLSDLSHYVLSKRTEFLLIKTTHPTCKLAARGFTDLKVQKIDKIKDLCKASPCSMSKAFTRQDSPLVSDLRHASLLCSIQQISLEPLCISLLHKLLELFLLETGPGCQMAVQAHYLAWIYGFESDFFFRVYDFIMSPPSFPSSFVSSPHCLSRSQNLVTPQPCCHGSKM